MEQEAVTDVVRRGTHCRAGDGLQKMRDKKQPQRVASEHIGRYYDPGDESPDLSVKDLVRVKRKPVQKRTVHHGYHVSDNISGYKPEGQIRYGELAKFII